MNWQSSGIDIEEVTPRSQVAEKPVSGARWRTTARIRTAISSPSFRLAVLSVACVLIARGMAR